MRWILRSKIHKATVTDAELDYIGSITLDKDLDIPSYRLHQNIYIFYR